MDAEGTLIEPIIGGGEDLADDQEAQEESRPKRTLCEVCAENPYKYTCPGCEKMTCSLPCSKKHKQDTGCNGKRDRLKFVSLQEFDDRVLLSGESRPYQTWHVRSPCSLVTLPRSPMQ